MALLHSWTFPKQQSSIRITCSKISLFLILWGEKDWLIFTKPNQAYFSHSAFHRPNASTKITILTMPCSSAFDLRWSQETPKEATKQEVGGKEKTEQEKLIELFWTTENVHGMTSFYSYIIYVPVPQSSLRAETHQQFCLLFGKEGTRSQSRGSKIPFMHPELQKLQGSKHHPRVFPIKRWRCRAPFGITSTLYEGILPSY